VQHWINAEQNGLAATLVPVDAPMVTIGDIARGTWPKEYGHRKGTIFSYIMSNYTPEGYPAGQGGTFTFRYILTSATAFSPAPAGQLGWGALSPFEIDEIRPNDKPEAITADPASAKDSFIHVDAPNVVLVNWKPAEDGNGSILRLLETGGKSSTLDIEIPIIDISAAWRCDAVERNQAQVQFARHAITVDIKPFQILTVRIEGAHSSGGNSIPRLAEDPIGEHRSK